MYVAIVDYLLTVREKIFSINIEIVGDIKIIQCHRCYELFVKINLRFYAT